MLKLAFRNIFRHRTRTALTLAAIVFGVTGLVLSGGFIEDVFMQLREATIHSRLGHLQVYREGYLQAARKEPFRYLIDEPQSVTKRIRNIPHVVDVMGRLNFSGLANTGHSQLPIIGEGIEPEKEARLGTAVTIVSGQQLSESDMFGIVVGQGVANALQIEPGDALTLMVNTLEGALNTLELKVVGVFRSFSKDFDDRAVRIPLAAAQELLYTTAIHSLVIALDATEHTTTVAMEAGRTLRGGRFDIKTWHELADFYRKTVQLYERQFGILQFIILAMVLLSVSSSVNMAIHERTGEFGTLMALGSRGKNVFALILTENAILGVFGAVIGILTGVLAAWLISAVGIPMPPPPNSNSGYTAHIRIVPTVICLALVVGLTATVLASILPARRAARMLVADALQQNV